MKKFVILLIVLSFAMVCPAKDDDQVPISKKDLLVFQMGMKELKLMKLEQKLNDEVKELTEQTNLRFKSIQDEFKRNSAPLQKEMDKLAKEIKSLEATEKSEKESKKDKKKKKK